jgi:hypothetical protein
MFYRQAAGAIVAISPRTGRMLKQWPSLLLLLAPSSWLFLEIDIGKLLAVVVRGRQNRRENV